jgi:flagellin-like protein
MKVRKRAGISEVMAAVITIAITVIAGAALFGYINGEATNSENKLGTANAANVNFLNEQFVVAQIVYDSYPTTNQLTIYFYNSGHVVDNFVSIDVFNSTSGTTNGDTPMNVLYNGTNVLNLNKPGCNVPNPYGVYENELLGNAPMGSNKPFSVPIGGIASITLTLPGSGPHCAGGTGTFKQGNVYGVKVIGQYGNVVTSYQGM